MPAIKKNMSLVLHDAIIINKIYFIRGLKVMIDRDLAEMYGVETKRLKEAVKRNMQRFPEDFMFEMTAEELSNWRSQIATSNSDRMGLRYPPFCFTEQGVAMLSGILNSEIAIQVNIQIIRIFSKMKEALLAHKDILLSIEKLEKDVKQNKQDIALIFEALKQLLNPPQTKRRMIGFKNND
jgi:phage regulator Rha-like protein